MVCKMSSSKAHYATWPSCACGLGRAFLSWEINSRPLLCSGSSCSSQGQALRLAWLFCASNCQGFSLALCSEAYSINGNLVSSLPTISRSPMQKQVTVKGNWFGFGSLWHLKEMRLLTGLSLVFFFAYGPLEVALPLYADKLLHAGAEGYGLLWFGFGVGAVV